MSEAALIAMKRSGHVLLGALAGRDLLAIEGATSDYRAAVEAVRATGGWHLTPQLAAEARGALAGVDRLTVRVSDLTQLSAHRQAALEAAGAAPLYGRTAR